MEAPRRGGVRALDQQAVERRVIAERFVVLGGGIPNGGLSRSIQVTISARARQIVYRSVSGEGPDRFGDK